MKIAIAIATTGRSEVLKQTLQRLGRQTRAADRVLVVGAADTDFPLPRPAGTIFALGAKGLTRQRNRALDLLAGTCDVVIFLDDDFVPARDFVSGVARLMAEHPDVVAASGHVLADGFASAGISFAEADALIAAYEREESADGYIVAQPGAYGCNMAIRLAALSGQRFDETLPLYGWLEDLDFTAPLAKLGRIVRTGLCAGVHLGLKNGRVPGVQLGYSQVANPVYLAAKGTMGRRAALAMALKNVAANTARSFRPEAHVDRLGRLRGNLLALRDLAMGKCHPSRVLDLGSPIRAWPVSMTTAP